MSSDQSLILNLSSYFSYQPVCVREHVCMDVTSSPRTVFSKPWIMAESISPMSLTCVDMSPGCAVTITIGIPSSTSGGRRQILVDLAVGCQLRTACTTNCHDEGSALTGGGDFLPTTNLCVMILALLVSWTSDEIAFLFRTTSLTTHSRHGVVRRLEA